MSNVLFTHSYFYKYDPKQWHFKQPYPPLGTIQAAAVIREGGFSVSLFDTSLKDGPEGLGHAIQQQQAKYLIIYDDGFNYLTKMCLTIMREAAFEMATEGKKQGCVVIVCSSDATDHYEKYFPHGVDYVIKGEGEGTLKELLLTIKKKQDPSTVQGLVFKSRSETIITQPRAVIKNLDALPLPAWDLVDIPAYKAIWKRHHGYFSLNIATTRGCPFKCNWCAKPIYGNRYNCRSPKSVIDEIEFLITHYQPDHFWMCDDIFGLKPGWVKEFKQLTVSKALKFGYKIQSRVDLLLEEDTIDSLAQSGAQTVWVGAESGSQKILDAMEKGISVDQIQRATGLLRKKNLKIGFFLQFGHLGETLQDIQATIRLVLALMPDEIGISVSYPLPGTKFYDKVAGQLSEKKNWRDSDDLAMLFESTFKVDYYRQLHRYVHSIYRRKKGYNSLIKLFNNPLSINYRELRSCLSILYYIPTTITQHFKLKKLATA